MCLVSFCFRLYFPLRVFKRVTVTVADQREPGWIIDCLSMHRPTKVSGCLIFDLLGTDLTQDQQWKAAANSLLLTPLQCVSGLKSQLTARRAFTHPVISAVTKKRFSEKLAQDLDLDPWSCYCARAQQPLLHVWKAEPFYPLNTCSISNRTELLLYCDITVTSCMLSLASACIKVLEKQTRLRVDGWFVWKKVSSLQAAATWSPARKPFAFICRLFTRQTNQNNQRAASAVATFLWLYLIRLILSLASTSSSSSSL